MSNINDSYFDGYYKDIWKNIIPEQLTEKEVNFMLPYFNLQTGSNVLDLMCGYGRHAIALGRKGIHVTAIDNLPEYIDEINETVSKEKLPVKAIPGSIIGYQPTEQFDLVICMGNSLNFFDRPDVIKILSMVRSCLKPGGRMLINSWSLAEIVSRTFKEKGEGIMGGMQFNTASKMLANPNRMETESTIISPDGKTEKKTAIDYIYSVKEMEEMLKGAGLTLQKIYSIPGRKEFSEGEPRAYIVASL